MKWVLKPTLNGPANYPESSAWLLAPQTWKTAEGSDVVLIRKPTASNLSHRLLNPFISRNIQTAGTLGDLASLLNTPDDWEARYNLSFTHSTVPPTYSPSNNGSFLSKITTAIVNNQEGNFQAMNHLQNEFFWRNGRCNNQNTENALPLLPQ